MSKPRILITGASRGIGAAIATYIAGPQYDLTLTYHQNASAADSVLTEVLSKGSTAQILKLDLQNRSDCRQILEADIEKNGAYYGVICNAGIACDTAFPAMTEQEWDSVIHTNLDGFYAVLHPILMPMIQKRQGGRIITLSSVSGLMGNRGQVNYSAAKAGIIGATKALALEVAKRNITVNCIAPGVIETDMIEGIRTDEALDLIPMRRFGKPNEVASLVRYLLSEDAGYITRQVFSVNGGLL